MLCKVSADTSGVPKKQMTSSQGTYYSQDFSVKLLFGLTELKAQLCWMENVCTLHCFIHILQILTSYFIGYSEKASALAIKPAWEC